MDEGIAHIHVGGEVVVAKDEVVAMAAVDMNKMTHRMLEIPMKATRAWVGVAVDEAEVVIEVVIEGHIDVKVQQST